MCIWIQLILFAEFVPDVCFQPSKKKSKRKPKLVAEFDSNLKSLGIDFTQDGTYKHSKYICQFCVFMIRDIRNGKRKSDDVKKRFDNFLAESSDIWCYYNQVVDYEFCTVCSQAYKLSKKSLFSHQSKGYHQGKKQGQPRRINQPPCSSSQADDECADPDIANSPPGPCLDNTLPFTPTLDRSLSLHSPDSDSDFMYTTDKFNDTLQTPNPKRFIDTINTSQTPHSKRKTFEPTTFSTPKRKRLSFSKQGLDKRNELLTCLFSSHSNTHCVVSISDAA